jgi:hypothetical protein
MKVIVLFFHLVVKVKMRKKRRMRKISILLQYLQVLDLIKIPSMIILVIHLVQHHRQPSQLRMMEIIGKILPKSPMIYPRMVVKNFPIENVIIVLHHRYYPLHLQMMIIIIENEINEQLILTL